MLISSAKSDAAELILRFLSRVGVQAFGRRWPELSQFLLAVGAITCTALFVRSLVLKARTVTLDNGQLSVSSGHVASSALVSDLSWSPLATDGNAEPYSAISELLADVQTGDQPHNPYLESSVIAGAITPAEQSSTHVSVAVSLPARTLLGFMIESGDYIMSPDGRWAQVDIVVSVSDDEADLLMRSGASAPILRIRLEEQYQIRRG
jgi:hypothetical protein